MAHWLVIDNFAIQLDTRNHTPIKRTKIRGRLNPCVTEIRALMKTSDKWRKLARKTNDPLAWSKTFPSAQQFSFRSVEQCEIENIILSQPEKLKGPIKFLCAGLKSSYCFTVNDIPTLWKLTPILKNGDHEKTNNNRSISSLPTRNACMQEPLATNQACNYIF